MDPRYGGRGTAPLRLDPFKVQNGVLSIVASRTPPDLKPALFNNEYISGLLTAQGTFSQKHGYFEIRAKIPVGHAVWPAFWMLAAGGRRAGRPRRAARRSRDDTTGKIQSCGFDFAVADAVSEFHNYGMLWEEDRLVYFIYPGARLRRPGPARASHA